MKLDTKALRYLTHEDWRVLTAVETGSKTHEVVPTTLIIKLSHLRSGSGVHKSISILAKANLIARTKNAKCTLLFPSHPKEKALSTSPAFKHANNPTRSQKDDGYRLTYGGLDYLALHTHLQQKTLYSTGNCIGCGKESDIYVCAPPPSSSSTVATDAQTLHGHHHPLDSVSDGSNNKQHILKIHRLGRISFRTIKANRDYLRHRTSASWMYMSSLAAQKEFIFMKALSEAQFAVPEAIARSRHTVVMGLVEGVPLRSVRRVGDAAGLYGELMEIIVRLARFGLIHGDFNEFNIMVQDRDDDGDDEDDTDVKATARIKPVVIDFPQMVSIDHENAEMYFDRDVNCIKTFFKRKFGFTSKEPGPFLADVRRAAGEVGSRRLDVEVEASGFSKKMAKELEKYMKDVGVDGDGSHDAHGHSEVGDLYDPEETGEEEYSEGESGDDKSVLDAN